MPASSSQGSGSSPWGLRRSPSVTIVRSAPGSSSVTARRWGSRRVTARTRTPRGSMSAATRAPSSSSPTAVNSVASPASLASWTAATAAPPAAQSKVPLDSTISPRPGTRSTSANVTHSTCPTAATRTAAVSHRHASGAGYEIACVDDLGDYERRLRAAGPAGPPRFGPAELAAFVLVPALLPLIFGGQVTSALVTAAGNLLLVGLVYAVVGFGVPSIVAWAGRRLAGQLAASLLLLTRAIPLLLFFALLIFLTVEMWQVFASGRDALLVIVAALLVLLGSVFL